MPESFYNLMSEYETSKAMDVVWLKISGLDDEIQKTQPFKLIKTDKERAIKIIIELVIKLYIIAKILEPFLPQTSEKILDAIKSNKMPATLFPRIN
jgi:methionyl-tRNA synthetase